MRYLAAKAIAAILSMIIVAIGVVEMNLFLGLFGFCLIALVFLSPKSDPFKSKKTMSSD